MPGNRGQDPAIFFDLVEGGVRVKSVLVSRLMAAPEGHDITRLLLAWSEGDDDALGKLAPLVEVELMLPPA